MKVVLLLLCLIDLQDLLGFLTYTGISEETNSYLHSFRKNCSVVAQLQDLRKELMPSLPQYLKA